MAVRSVVRSPVASPVRGVFGVQSGPGVPTARFTGDPYTEGDTSIIVQVTNATIGETWAIAVNSDGGGTEVTDTGTVATASFQIDLDISGLSVGTADLSYTEDSVEVSTDTALIEAVQDALLLETDDTLLLESGDRMLLEAA